MLAVIDTKPNSEGFFSKCGRLTSQKFYILRKPKIVIKKINNIQEDNSLFVEEFPQEVNQSKPTPETSQQQKFRLTAFNSRTNSYSLGFSTPQRSRSQNFTRNLNQMKKLSRFDIFINKKRERSLQLSRMRLDFSKITQTTWHTDFE